MNSTNNELNRLSDLFCKHHARKVRRNLGAKRTFQSRKAGFQESKGNRFNETLAEACGSRDLRRFHSACGFAVIAAHTPGQLVQAQGKPKENSKIGVGSYRAELPYLLRTVLAGGGLSVTLAASSRSAYASAGTLIQRSFTTKSHPSVRRREVHMRAGNGWKPQPRASQRRIVLRMPVMTSPAVKCGAIGIFGEE